MKPKNIKIRKHMIVIGIFIFILSGAFWMDPFMVWLINIAGL